MYTEPLETKEAIAPGDTLKLLSSCLPSVAAIVDAASLVHCYWDLKAPNQEQVYPASLVGGPASSRCCGILPSLLDIELIRKATSICVEI